jgi:hypothetical protein
MTGKKGIVICNSIKQCIGKKEAEEFASSCPLSKFADYIHKFKWAQNVCEYLDNRYQPNQVMKIRMNCSCSPSEDDLITTKEMYDKSSNLDDFCNSYNSENDGIRKVWHDSEVMYFSYPRCYCSAVKRMNENISKTWCLCTLGYAKKLFDYILDADTQVELIESVKTGGKQCVMKIIR